MLSRLLLNIKLRSKATLRAWSYQCESIIAQRSRRVQQLFTFYHRVYGGNGLKQLLRSYRTQFQPPLQSMMMSAVLAAGLTFDWDAERIKLSSFDVCSQDIEFLENLDRNETCGRCLEKNIRYCYCLWMEHSETNNIFEREAISKHRQYTDLQKDDGKSHWEPYVSKDEFTIWRREEGNSLYSYKVYACFDDVTASDLLHVQTDIEYRKRWDDSAVALELIERDTMAGTNSDLIYWEMRWPKMFTNRDYVFCRRYVTDEKRNLIMLCNRSTSHPKYPESPGKIRVKEYWSYMVMKPIGNFDEPGVHYIITYFDDPGLAIPQSIKSWITQSQMPEFLKKMHLATKQYSFKKTIQMHYMDTMKFISNEYTKKAIRPDWK